MALLENGANSSFVNSLLDHAHNTLAEHPNQRLLLQSITYSIKRLSVLTIYFLKRKNSAGFDLSEPENLNTLQQNFKEFKIQQ